MKLLAALLTGIGLLLPCTVGAQNLNAPAASSSALPVSSSTLLPPLPPTGQNQNSAVTSPNTVTFSSVIRGQVALALYPKLPTYRLGNGDLSVGIQGIDTTGTGRVSAVLLLANKMQLPAPELTILTQLVGNMATQCFNISSERLVNISDWLIKSNASSALTPQTAHFGPLDITYRPWQYTSAVQLASIVLSRKGKPSEEPWTRSCSL